MPLSQNNWTIKTAAEALSKNEFSSKELTEDYLERAQSKNDELNAYLTFTIDDARAAAAA